jgi:uncharacterized YigZ family protein
LRLISLRFPIPDANLHRTQIEIKRSRFIASAYHTPSAQQAQAFLKSIREEFHDATHHCWAYVCGPPGDTRIIGMSDDGEPHGTAGKPMLNVLIHAPVGEITCVVTRYYGGTKLGTGGLARAYSRAVEEVLGVMKYSEFVPRKTVTASIEYNQLNLLKQRLPEFEVAVLKEDFSDVIHLRLSLPEEHLESFSRLFSNLTHGRSLLTTEGTEER